MSIDSFSKGFTLSTKKEVESFIKIVNTPVKSNKINKKLLTPERLERGEQKVKQMLKR